MQQVSNGMCLWAVTALFTVSMLDLDDTTNDEEDLLDEEDGDEDAFDAIEADIASRARDADGFLVSDEETTFSIVAAEDADLLTIASYVRNHAKDVFLSLNHEVDEHSIESVECEVTNVNLDDVPVLMLGTHQ